MPRRWGHREMKMELAGNAAKMNPNEKDILTDIPDDELEDLAEMYRKYEDKYPHVYSFIKTGIRARQTNLYDVIFMSMGDSWRKDGAFLAIMPRFGCDVFLFTLENSGKTLLQAVATTHRLRLGPNERRPYIMYFTVHENFCDELMRVLTQERKSQIVFLNPNNMYYLNKEEALKFTTECPPDVYMQELQPSDAQIIDDSWLRNFPGSKERIEALIKLNGGYGIYLQSNHQLVSWVTLSCLGQISTLKTLDHHRKKGYASLLTKRISKRLAERGFHPFATVDVGNTASEGMFEKLGFKRIGSCKYIGATVNC